MEANPGATWRQRMGRALPRRDLSRWLLGGMVGVRLTDWQAEHAGGKDKKKRKRKEDCPRGQQKDAHGICGKPPTDCLTVGALCSGTKQQCCSDQCVYADDGYYRCLPGKARCLVDYGCVQGYVCRGYRCVPG